MPIVFDEVTGSVEPPRERSAPASSGAASASPESAPAHQLRAELRRLQHRTLRTRAS